MATRAERLAAQEARAKARLDAQRKQLAQVQAQLQDEARKALTKRRAVVGQLVLDTALARVDDATLGQLFALLSTLADVPEPVACLEELLRPSVAAPVVPGNGCAHPADGVTAVQ